MTDIKVRTSGSGLRADDIETVFCAVYAGTYWNKTSMNPEILTTNFSNVFKIEKGTALNFAKNSMKQWRGILSRKTLQDTGIIPCPYTLTASADIICTKIYQSSNPDTYIENWDNIIFTEPQIGNNYVYVRCQNVNFMGDITPTVKVFIAKPSAIVPPPSEWRTLYTYESRQESGDVLLHGGKVGPLNKNIKGVSEAFLYEADSDAHVCIVGCFSSEFFDNSLDIPQGNWNMTTWLQNNGAAVWQHNVNPQLSKETTLKLYNHDGRPEKFIIEAECINVPKGTMVALNYDNTNLKNINSDNVKISHEYQIIETEATLPANYNGELKVVIQTPDGKLLPKGASVEINSAWLLDHTHKRYLDAADLLQANKDARASRNIKVPMGSYTIVGTSN